MKSIRTKLFAVMSIFIVLIILLYLGLNSLVLEEYYSYKKRIALVETYNTIYNYYKNDYENTEYELLKLKSTKNIDIIIKDQNLNTTFTSIKEPDRGPKLGIGLYKKEIGNLGDKNYVVGNSHDERFNFRNLGLTGKLDNGNYIFLRTPLEAIKESTKTSNEFLIIVGGFVILLSGFIAFVAAKKFTNPILEISAIAKNMAELNFEKRYTVENNDEIGILGNSINSLAESLEKTIDELKEANLKLESDIKIIKGVDEMRKEFLANVSHELKTPLALIQGYSEGLRDNVITNDENRAYYAEVILDEAVKMDRLVRQLLDLNQLEFGKHQLALRNFNIVQLIEAVIKKHKVLLLKNDVDVKFENIGPVMVDADEFLIETVLTNYLTNAINHVDSNKNIAIELENFDNRIRIYVLNSGKNIDEEEIDKIWGSFYKTDKARSRQYGGSGLGLAVVLAIARLHDTKCGVENTETGVRFWFDIKNFTKTS